jgi:hypothetical protein
MQMLQCPPVSALAASMVRANLAPLTSPILMQTTAKLDFLEYVREGKIECAKPCDAYLSLKGDATITEGVLSLVKDVNSVGTAWYTAMQTINLGFSASFSVRATTIAKDYGFAFVLQAADAFFKGSGGTDLGYRGLAKYLAIRIERTSPKTFVDNTFKTLFKVYVETKVDGVVTILSQGDVFGRYGLDNGDEYDYKVVFLGTPPLLRVYAGDRINHVLSVRLDAFGKGIVDYIGGKTAFAGFSAATFSTKDKYPGQCRHDVKWVNEVSRDCVNLNSLSFAEPSYVSVGGLIAGDYCSKWCKDPSIRVTKFLVTTSAAAGTIGLNEHNVRFLDSTVESSLSDSKSFSVYVSNPHAMALTHQDFTETDTISFGNELSRPRQYENGVSPPYYLYDPLIATEFMDLRVMQVPFSVENSTECSYSNTTCPVNTKSDGKGGCLLCPNGTFSGVGSFDCFKCPSKTIGGGAGKGCVAADKRMRELLHDEF